MNNNPFDKNKTYDHKYMDDLNIHRDNEEQAKCVAFHLLKESGWNINKVDVKTFVYNMDAPSGTIGEILDLKHTFTNKVTSIINEWNEWHKNTPNIKPEVAEDICDILYQFQDRYNDKLSYDENQALFRTMEIINNYKMRNTKRIQSIHLHLYFKSKSLTPEQLTSIKTNITEHIENESKEIWFEFLSQEEQNL